MLPKTLRAAGAVLAFVALCWLYDNHGRRILNRPEPPNAAPSPLGREIQNKLAAGRYNRILRDYRFTQSLLEQASRAGHDIRPLAAKMPRVLELARTGDYDGAAVQLNLIEVRIPRKGERVVPAGEDDPPAPRRRPRRRREAR